MPNLHCHFPEVPQLLYEPTTRTSLWKRKRLLRLIENVKKCHKQYSCLLISIWATKARRKPKIPLTEFTVVYSSDCSSRNGKFRKNYHDI